MTRIAEHALRELESRFGNDGAAAKVSIEGADPVLPTRFPVGEAAAAVLAAGGSAAAALWMLRGGRSQKVRVGVRAAAASLTSFLHLRVEDMLPPAALARLANPATALYPTRDGRWIHLHGGFPHLAEGTARVLGCALEREAIARAVSNWDAEPLDAALAEARLCAAVVRSAAAWAAHPQGAALARQPVIEVERIGDAPPAPAARPVAGDAPLAGLRVLDLTRVLAGPSCARTLASYGADVLRVDGPGRPFIRHFAIDTGHGKRSAHVDLDTVSGRETLTGLVRSADVFSQSYRPGALARRGLGPHELAALRPGIVHVSISCYGAQGPWAERAGWEQLAQSATGLAAAHGAPGPPRLLPAAACDYLTGYLAAYGVLRALARRAREGGSWAVRASLCQTGSWLHRLGATHPVDPAAAKPPDADEIAALSTESSGPLGRVRYLSPAVALSETPVRWRRPVVPIGHDAPVWLDAGAT